MLKSCPKCKQAVMGLTGKIGMLDKPVAGHELNVNESTVYIK